MKKIALLIFLTTTIACPGASIPGTVVSDKITTGNTLLTGFGIGDTVEMTGTCKQVATTNDMFTIPASRRTEGMTCYVVADGVTRRLVGGTDNTNWATVTYGMGNPYSGTFTAGGFIATSDGFVGDGSGLYNIQSGVAMKKMNLIFVGDSLTQEAGAGTDNPHVPPYSTYPLYLRNMWTNVYASYLNRGVGGWELYNVTNDWVNVLASTDLSLSNNMLFVWVGANDFWPYDSHSITNANTWLVTWDRYCSNAQMAGMKVVGFTVEDRNGTINSTNAAVTPQAAQFRSDINAGIRVGAHIDYLVDMDAQNLSMGTNFNWRTYDGTHPNTNGAIWQARYVDLCVKPSFNLMSQLSWFNVQVVGPPALDKDYLNFIARAQIPTTNTVLCDAIAKLVQSGKVNGWWPIQGAAPYLDALYIFTGGTALSASQNLVNTNYTITWNGNVYFTNGLSGDGVTGYGDTGFNPSLGTGQYQQTDALLACDLGTSLTSTNYAVAIGCSEGTNIYGTFPAGAFIGMDSINDQVRLNCNIGNGLGPSYGMLIACRTNSTTYGYAQYGVSPTLSATTVLADSVSGGLPNTNFTVLALASTTNGVSHFWNGPLRAAAFGRSMPAPIAAKLWNDIRVFNANPNRPAS